MKSFVKPLSFLLSVIMLVLVFAACGENKPASGDKNIPDGDDPVVVTDKDYASSVEFDKNSETVKTEVTVKTFVDGDTTHFNVDKSIMPDGLLKARYLAINTPESTGKIEEYGKKASNFTKEKLKSATSIYIESDDENWNADSTGDRYLVWVWYKPEGSESYRNLNIEILQNGLAIASSSANNRYGSVCTSAIAQARAQKLNVYSGQKDPDFYYGEAVELTLKELRCDIEAYNGKKVAFTGIITLNDDNSVYIEEYDAETDMYYGISVYYGFGLSGGHEILRVGNQSRIVGTVQYYEAGGTYQVSGLTYRAMKPDDPNNIKLISSGHSAAFALTTPKEFAEGKVQVAMEEEVKTFDYAELAMSTSVEMKNLTVKSVYTTLNESSSSYGAMTLTCEGEGVTVDVRTVVFRDANGDLYTEDMYKGKNIDVRGIVDFFDGKYQIKVLTPEHITVNN